MMRHLILVVDDHWQQRMEGYKRLEAALAQSAPDLGLALEFLEAPDKLVAMTRRTQYCAAILDVVLDEAWPRFTVRDAIRDLGANMPFATISARWDATDASQMDDALKRPNWRGFLHWRDLDPTGDGDLQYSVRAICRIVYDHLEMTALNGLDSNASLRIVHMSDVQTGGAKTSALRLEANRCADRILEYWQDTPPTFVAFTGDVTERASPAEFERAQEWISYLFARLKLGSLPAPNLFCIPGNHDVNLALSASCRIKFTSNKSSAEAPAYTLENDIQSKELLSYAYGPYRRFLAAVSHCPLLDPDNESLAWVEGRFRQLGLVFYGLNTARPANAFGLPGREVDPDALARIGDELKELKALSEDSPPLIVGLGHHCPSSANDDSAVTNPDLFEKFFAGEAKTALFLHGHTHQHELVYSSNNGYRLVRSCATTMTKAESARPPDTLRGFNLLELGRQDNTVTTLQAASFGWVGKDIRRLGDAIKWDRQPDTMVPWLGA